MRPIGYDWYDVYIWWIYPSVVKHDWVWTPLQIDDTFWFQWENQLYIDRGFSSTPCSRTAQNSASLWDFTTFGIRNVLLHTIRSIHCASFQDVGEQSIIKFLFLTLVFMYWFPYFFCGTAPRPSPNTSRKPWTSLQISQGTADLHAPYPENDVGPDMWNEPAGFVVTWENDQLVGWGNERRNSTLYII